MTSVSKPIMSDENLYHTYDAYLFSINKLAEALGCTRDTVRQRLARVPPNKTRNGFPVYHLRDVVKLIDDPANENPDELPPHKRKAWYEGELRRVDIEKKKGELIPAEEIRQVWAETLKGVMLTLDTLVDVVERDVGLKPDQIKCIQGIIDNQREILYAELCSQTQKQSLAS